MLLPVSRVLVRPSALPALQKASISTSPVRLGAHHGAHPVPPEGDIDHGRSGWGHQSHDRHEHFTFDNEASPHAEPEVKGGWKEWNTPFVRGCVIAFGIYLFPWSEPYRPDWKTHDLTNVEYDTISRTGEDDQRPIFVRIIDYLRPSTASMDKEHLDALDEYRRSSIQRMAHLRALVSPEAHVQRERPASSLVQFEDYNVVNGSPGQLRKEKSPVEFRTVLDDAHDVGLDWDRKTLKPREWTGEASA